MESQQQPQQEAVAVASQQPQQQSSDAAAAAALAPAAQQSSDAAAAAQQQPDPAPIQQLNCTLIRSSSWQRVWECADFLGRPCIIKQWQQQSSRHPLLQRKTKNNASQQDVAGMCRARKLGLPTPTPFFVDKQHSLVYTSVVEGTSLQQRLSEAQELDAGVEQLLSELGRLLARMHDGSVLHGGLSSSCVLVRAADQALVLQDFGFSFSSNIAKDKAADLVLLEADLQEQHPHLSGLFAKVVEAYNKHSKQWSAVFNRLPEVRNVLVKAAAGAGKQSKNKKQRTQ